LKTIAAVLAEGSNVMRLQLVPPGAVLALLADAHAGDYEAQRLVAIMHCLADKLYCIEAPSSGGPACLTCEQQFWRGCYPRLITVLNAECERPNAALVCGVCTNCYNTHSAIHELHEAVLRAMHDRFGLVARRLPRFSEAGHA
jgi:hypothetical protein